MFVMLKSTRNVSGGRETRKCRPSFCALRLLLTNTFFCFFGEIFDVEFAVLSELIEDWFHFAVNGAKKWRAHS